MALHQSKIARRIDTPPAIYQSGLVGACIATFAFTKAYATATDLIEIATLPAGARIIGATIFGDGVTAATTADVALLDGEAGDGDDTRDLTADALFTAAATTAAGDTATMAECLAIAPSDKHRGIGVQLSANQAAGAATLTLVIQYTM